MRTRAIETNRYGQVRCVWNDDPRPCSKVGRGNPPLCRHHYALTVEDRGGAAYNGFLADPHVNHAFDRLEGVAAAGADRLVAGLTAGLGTLIERITRPGAFSRPTGLPRSDARRPRGAPPPPPRGAQRSDASEDPRDVLGFAPDLVLTRELVKDRQRAMAALVHPDRGGSTRAMQRVNDAARRLLETIA